MKRLDIFISKEVQSKEEAATIIQAVRNKLTDQPDITVRAVYEDREEIEEVK